jgi:hypothetical protein
MFPARKPCAPCADSALSNAETGSHVILRREHRTVVVPMHRPIKPGTLAGLIAQSGVSLEAFCAEL